MLNTFFTPELRFLFRLCGFKKFISLIISMMIAALFETFSIFFVYFFIATMANTSSIWNSNKLSFVYNLFSFSSVQSFLIFFGISVFICLAIMNIFNAFNLLLINRFGYKKGSELETSIFKYYLNKPYTFYLNKNTNEFKKNILAESNRVINGILVNGLQCIARKIVLITIIFFLFIFEPLITASTAITFFALYFLIYRIIKLKLVRAGRMASQATTNRYKITEETFSSIKELYILKRTNKFIEDFSKNSILYAKSEALSQITPSMVKNLLELAAFGTVLIVSFITLIKNQNTTDVLPIIGLYAFSGYRLLPAAQQIFSGFTLAQYHWPALTTLANELSNNDLKNINLDTSKTDPIFSFIDKIELRNICYRYPSADYDSLSNINIILPKNNTIGIFGQTGSGKTTLLDVILGLLMPQKGQFLIDEINVSSGLIQSFNEIGYVSQNIQLIDDSIINNIAFGLSPSNINLDKVIYAAKLAQIHDFILTDLPNKYDTVVGENGIRLSGGQKQRIVIARALYNNPEILILDEATSALDCLTELAITDSINKMGMKKTIIIVSHRLKTLENCNIIYFIHNGKIADSGSFQYLYKNNPLFRKISTLPIEEELNES